MSMTQVPELLTVAEVASKLRLSDETVHRWARIGKLPYIDVLGVKRFRTADIEAILAGQPLPGASSGSAA
jgi:excisionase family DNA binding protein